MSKGYVYVLTNASMPGIVKIGRTERDPFARAAELHTTGLPTPFEVIACVLVQNAAALERDLHALFSAQRVSGNREFFQVAVSAVAENLVRLAQLDETNTTAQEVHAPPTDRPQELLELGRELLVGSNRQPANPVKAYAVLKEAALLGSGQACFELGKMSQTGLGCTRSEKAAVTWYQKGAAVDDLDCIYHLSYDRHNGEVYLVSYFERAPISDVSLERAFYVLVNSNWHAPVRCTAFFRQHMWDALLYAYVRLRKEYGYTEKFQMNWLEIQLFMVYWKFEQSASFPIPLQTIHQYVSTNVLPKYQPYPKPPNYWLLERVKAYKLDALVAGVSERERKKQERAFHNALYEAEQKYGS